jgi:hypothetical protein
VAAQREDASVDDGGATGDERQGDDEAKLNQMVPW